MTRLRGCILRTRRAVLLDERFLENPGFLRHKLEVCGTKRAARGSSIYEDYGAITTNPSLMISIVAGVSHIGSPSA